MTKFKYLVKDVKTDQLGEFKFHHNLMSWARRRGPELPYVCNGIMETIKDADRVGLL